MYGNFQINLIYGIKLKYYVNFDNKKFNNISIGTTSILSYNAENWIYGINISNQQISKEQISEEQINELNTFIHKLKNHIDDIDEPKTFICIVGNDINNIFQNIDLISDIDSE